MKRAFALFAALLLPISVTQAALIDIDSPLGPNTIARDTEQGLDWLDLRVTANMSIGEVLAETTAGGRLEGFRYTDYAEFRTLYLPFLTCEFVSGYCDNYQTMLYFLDTVGGNPEGFAAPYQLGMTQIDAGVPRVYVDEAFFQFSPEPIPRYGYDSQQLAVPYTMRSESGHFLVRPTQDIPEPMGALLLAIGALALTTTRRVNTAVRSNRSST